MGWVVGRQWNLEVSNQSFNIVDIKPSNMEDLTEVITSAEFHPTQCSTFAYSSSKGNIRLVDMRQSALCDSHAKLFEEQASTAHTLPHRARTERDDKKARLGAN